MFPVSLCSDFGLDERYHSEMLFVALTSSFTWYDWCAGVRLWFSNIVIC